MKRISVKKEVLVIMMIVVALLTICSKVFATGTQTGPIQIPTINTGTEPSTDPTTNAEAPTTPTQPVANTLQPGATNTTGSNYQNNTSLPQTGDASDYAIFLLIVVAIVIAVYAYRKVKEYNI